MRFQSRIFLLIILIQATSYAEKPLPVTAQIKANPKAIALALTVAQIKNLDPNQISAMLTKIFQQGESIETFAQQSSCAEFASADQLAELKSKGGALNPSTCYCTTDADIFNQWMAPVVQSSLNIDPNSLFTPHDMSVAGNTFRLTADANGVVKGGFFRANKPNRLKFRVWINNTERGESAEQHFCQFNGKFRLFTSTIEGKYIELDAHALLGALTSDHALDLSKITVENGRISYKQ